MLRLPLSVAALAVAVAAQGLPTESPRISSYEMTARLEPGQRTITGTQTIVWRNATGAPTAELRLHLYWNAFGSRSSTFMREAGEEFRAQWRTGELGGIELLEAVLLSEGTRVPLTMEFVRPDDQNPDDRTVVRLALPTPVAPGGSLTLATRFRGLAPKAYRRAGWTPGGGFFAMHWFPKLGVLEERDGAAVWNCPQFHANTEFFADFSTWKVRLDVPDGYVVGATGGEPVLDQVNDGRRVLEFVADDVHDFAWVADPAFRLHVEQFDGIRAVNDPTGVAPAVARFLGVTDLATFDLPPVQLRLLLQPEHDTAVQVRRHLDAAREALVFYGLRYGPWPYPALTLVDPGSDVDGHSLGGGMEYPMLITCGTSLRPHSRRLSPEGVTVHEFGHQYWYGLSANDEFKEAWLDEGINSYSESRAQVLAFAAVEPVQTAAYGPFTVAAAQIQSVPADPLEWLGVAPLDRAPARVQTWATAYHFEGTWIPDSPLLDLLFEQPLLTGFREAAAHPEWLDRARFIASEVPDSMLAPGWQTLSRDSYHANAYTRPATLLRTLERMVGRDRWWSFLRTFHAEARFAHPTTAGFVASLRRDCGAEAATFFEAATAAGAELDYAVHSVSPADGRGTEKSVVIRALGNLRADVRVRFRFEGRTQPVWREIARDAAGPWRAFRFRDADETEPFGRLTEVWIDPPGEGSPGTGEAFEAADPLAGTLVLDADLRNNVWSAHRRLRPGFYVGLRTLLQAQVRLVFAALIG